MQVFRDGQSGGQCSCNSRRIPCEHQLSANYCASTAMSELESPGSSRKPRRTSSAMRKEHLERGGFLVSLKRPIRLKGMTSQQRPVGIKIDVSKWDEYWRLYQNMARKGFRVTQDGCMIPEDHYLYPNNGKKAHTLSAQCVSYLLLPSMMSSTSFCSLPRRCHLTGGPSVRH